MVLEFSAPRALRTDTRFMANLDGDGCMNNQTRKALHANARRLGININNTHYDGRLARFQGDPKACYGSREEARAICRKLGKASEDLGVKPPTDETTGMPYRVADECVNRRVDRVVERVHGGSVTPTVRKKIAEEVREQITPPESSLL